MSNINDSGPAFPVQDIVLRDKNGFLIGPEVSSAGMTLRQYAAIKLKVPDSGADWLDEMISKSLRDDMAGKAMPAIYPSDYDYNTTARMAYEMADAMLEARE